MPTIQYVQGQPFLIPDEVTELPTGTQHALPVTQDWYPAGYDNQAQAALPAQPDMWATVARAGKRLLGVGGEERYQTWPERTIRSALTLPAEVYQGTVQTGPGLRREDVTDIPGTAQPLDPLIERAQDVAGLAGGTMFAGVKPGVASLGAGPVRPHIEIKPFAETPMFYSNVENAVKASKQNAASKDQWLSYLKNQPGVKPEELEWTVGNLPEGKITKQQLEQHIAENKMQFNEVWKESVPKYQQKLNEFDSELTKKYGEEWVRNENVLSNEEKNKLQELRNNRPQDWDLEKPKYQSYQLPGGPLSRDTEILTREGWKRIDIVSVNDEVMTRKDDGTLEWKTVQAVPAMYAEKLYHFFNQSIDMQVTANHKMVVKKRRRSLKGIYRITAKELWNTSECVIPLTGYWNGQGTDRLFGLDAVDIAEFIGWYLAEGSYKKSLSGAKNTIQISQSRWSNPENCDRLESLFDRLGFSWNYYGECYGVGSKTIPKELLNLIYNQPTSEGKFVPKFFFNQNKNVIAALLEALILGDGHTTKEGFNLYNNYIQSRRIFFSKSKQLADDVQVLALLAGYRANVRKRPTGLYVVGLNLKEWCSVDDAKHNIVDYNDYAYCVTVENHCIYVRRNGVAAFTGNSNYRELLLTLPDTSLKTKNNIAKEIGYTNDYKDLSFRDQNIVDNFYIERIKDNKIPEFRSSHWEEPNVLAHIRMNDRNIPDVGKSLHIEEIQSDWHQAGRKQGYIEKDIMDRSVIKNKMKEIENKAPSNLSGIEHSQWLENQPEYIRLRNEYNSSIPNNENKVPNAPFKKTWDELALKRTINEAVRNGYDAISWTPGEAQAARYDLSKQVDRVDYTPKTGELLAHKGSNIVLKEKNVSADKLADYIGKEAAEKILNNPTSKFKNDTMHVLTGNDLKVGGQGMKAFYDKMMVDKVNALAKKYGGKVETKEIPISTKEKLKDVEGMSSFEAADYMKKNKNKGQPVHVLKLTPELKKAVSEKGFPLFTGGIPHVPPPEEPTFDERWRDRVPDEMTKRDQIKDLLEQQKIRNLPLDYTPPERKFEGRPVHLTKVDFIPEF